MTRTLVSIATQPRRERILAVALASLRPQVDRIHVYLNGFRHVPDCVRKHADEWEASPVNLGAERKFHWAGTWEGIQLSCDDDFVYPSDYAETVVRHVEHFGGEAVCTFHGRALRENATTIDHVIPERFARLMETIKTGRFGNYPGTGVMAWDDRRIVIPKDMPGRNMADLQLAMHLQSEGVPVWLMPHTATWIRPLAPSDQLSIFYTSRRVHHKPRNATIAKFTAERGGWRVYELPGADTAPRL